MELFKTMTGTNFVHIPYKGGGPALVDVLAGQVQVLFTPPVSATQHVQAGRLRALAVSTAKRSAGMPDLPTIAESGVPGYDSGVWYGVLAPAGTPREIVMRVNGDVVKALQQPDFRTMLIANSIDPIGSSPEGLAQFIRIELAKWAKVVRDADVRVD
jgi:tripartite-type tricarboxylate transporter receptor subunit TctC